MTDTNKIPDLHSAACILQGTIGQIEFARNYTLELLNATPADRWFEMPSGLPTNIAWQVGHLTVSQYGLLMFRVRGRRPEDLELIPGRFRKAYGRQSEPMADPAGQPSAEELLQRLARVHELALEELRQAEPSVLLEPVEMPYAAYPVKLGAVMFCPMHEQIHAGQIGLLRRALGLSPVR
ncbi:MAG: DinB family protein [Fuerstiella sp.]